MKKLNILLLFSLLMASQVFAQQQQSFAEYWFGIKPQNSIKTTSKKAPEKPAKSLNNNINTKDVISVSTVITLDLSQPTNPESFDLDGKGVWTQTYNELDYPWIEFNNSTFLFSHLIGGEYASWDGTFWDGFTYSKNGDNTDYNQGGSSSGSKPNEWGNMAGGGIKTDAAGNVLTDKDGIVLTDPDIPYLLAYWGMMDGAYDDHILTVAFDNTYKAKSIYINNSPWAYYSNQNGDGFARALDQEGDYLRLIIHGLDKSRIDNGKEVVYTLAEYKNGELIQSPHWELVDLSSLGEIDGIYFTMESSDSDPLWGMNTSSYFCLDKLQVETVEENLVEYNYTITVPQGVNVSVSAPGYSGYNYKPFTEKEKVAVLTAEGKTTYYYNVTGKHAYRVSQEGMLTQVGVFTPSASATSVEITSEQLSSHSPNEINHDVTANNSYNVSDLFMNINEKGHLNLSSGETYQLINHRSWTLVDNTINNYFLEPDYHYTVISENGEEDNSVVNVDNNGLLTAVGSGTAIVLVTYDAINANYALGGPFFSALWAENTGVFVVSVDASVSGITSGMLINESLNTDASHKLATTAVDAELDVFYYLEEQGGYDYTFTPSGVTSVTLAQPVVGSTMTTYNGFSTDNVANNGDGSYTLRLIQGRNIVKLTSAAGEMFQVLTAKAVNYTLTNLTTPGNEYTPGDEISVKFNTLYHPCGKLAGIYNMSAGIQYNGVATKFPIVGGPAQYTFASKAQEYKIIIPQNFTGEQFILSNGVIKADGFGNPYGAHRNITLEQGVNTGFSAMQRTAYFGALPEIAISLQNGTTNLENIVAANNINVYPNPFADYIVVEAATHSQVAIYNIAGQCVFNTSVESGETRIQTANLSKGTYILKCGGKVVKMVK